MDKRKVKVQNKTSIGFCGVMSPHPTLEIVPRAQ